MNIRRRIVDIAATAFSVPPDKIDPNLGWEDQDADSFALVEVLVGIQEEFQVRFQPSELRRIRNLEEMIALVEGKVTTNE